MRPAWVPGQHRADDDLLAGDHELAVVPGEVALLVAHHPHVGVGDVRSRLGVVAVGAWLVAGAAPAAPLAGRGGCVPGFLFSPLRAAAGLVLGGQPVPGGGQPLPPFGSAGQLKIMLDGVDHLVFQPLEMYLDLGFGGVQSLGILDKDNAWQIVQLRDPLMLPRPAAIT